MGAISCSAMMPRILQDGASLVLHEKVLALCKPLVRSLSRIRAGARERERV